MESLFAASRVRATHRHVKWVEFLQIFIFMLKHKSNVKNVVADALSRKETFLVMIESKFIGFEVLKEHYHADEDIKLEDISADCSISSNLQQIIYPSQDISTNLVSSK